MRLLAVALPVLVASGTARAEPNLVIRGSGDCPSPAAVSEILEAARPNPEWPSVEATFEVVEERIRIGLGPDPSLWREVPAPADCADRAKRAALVIAAWSGELPSQTPSVPSLTVAVPPPVPVRATVPKPSAALLELGFAGFYSTMGGWAPGARIELAWFRRAGWWGLRAVGSYQSTKSLRVDIGKAEYERTSLGAALVLRWNGLRYFASSDWGMSGYLVRVHGDGYTQNDSASGLNVALEAGARAGLRVRSVRVWADAVGCRWLGKETIQVDPLSVGLSTTADLPRWDVRLGLGAGVVFD